MPAAAYERMAEGRPIAGLLMVQQTSPVGPIIEKLLLAPPHDYDVVLR